MFFTYLSVPQQTTATSITNVHVQLFVDDIGERVYIERYGYGGLGCIPPLCVIFLSWSQST